LLRPAVPRSRRVRAGARWMRQRRAAQRLRELHGWRRRGASASTFFWYDFEYCGWPLFCSPLRYRLHIPFATGYESMSPFRYRNEPPYIYVQEEEESPSRNAIFVAIGAAAGFAAGVLMAERFGGFKGLTDRIKDTFGGGTEGEENFDYEGLEEDEFDPDFDEEVDTQKGSLNGSEEREERVREAFRNEP